MSLFYRERQARIAGLIIQLCNIKVALMNAHERGDQYSSCMLIAQYCQCCSDIINEQAELVMLLQDLYDSLPYGVLQQDSNQRPPD